MSPPVVFLMGPTATGKTGTAVELVARLPLEIVSVDSAMVYRGMDIGTAKPGPEILARAPHRLIDIRDPAEPYSGARFREDALREMAQIVGAGRVPLLVGGTMLYFRALEQGLTALPQAHPEIRQRLVTEAERLGWVGLHRRLQAVDPTAAARIRPSDPQRLQRALEVYEVTGEPMSALLRRGARQGLPYRVLKLGLLAQDRGRLRARIAQRLARMLEQGLVAEVQALYRRGDLDPRLPAMRAVGYRQVWAYLEGRVDLETMGNQVRTATAQLAKRQLTWLRSEPGLTTLDPENTAVSHMVEVIQAHLG
jgi:tRNA dimethylallyltransferase